MSSTSRKTGLEMAESVCTGLIRRMVNLPRHIHRAMDHGLDLIRPPTNPPEFPPPHSFNPNVVHEEWAFLAAFEQGFGVVHPFFYACRFAEALKMAREERKLVFVYLHAPAHPFTPSFCGETLCSEVVVQTLDAGFVSWGGLVDRGDGSRMAATLRPGSFPFCAVVAPALGDGFIVIQQIEGPVSPTELLEILQQTIEEQGSVSDPTKEEEKRMNDRRLREEQDIAYFRSLQIDKEKGKMSKTNHGENKGILNKKEATKTKKPQHQDNALESSQATKVLIRFPNGERKEKGFLCTDKVQAIFEYVDSVGLSGVGGNYKMVSSFPRKVYGADQMGITLKDAGLYPKATLFLEFV